MRSRHGIAIGWLVLALAAAILPARAAAQDCLARTSAGFVTTARLRSGVAVSIDGPFEASFAGRRARISIPSLGLTASAEVGEIEVQIVSTIAARDGVFLTPRSRVRARSVEGARASVGVLATDLSIESIEIPSAALALAGAERCPVAAGAPAEWDALERALPGGHEQLVREDVILRGRAGGRPGAVHVVRGARVVRIEESGTWSRVVIDSDGTRAVGWVSSSALEPAPTREVGGGGGMAMGSGRLRVGCLGGERGVRATTIPADVALHDRPRGRTLATIPAGTMLELGATHDHWIAVVGALGIHRIPRNCAGDDSGLGWIPESALGE